MRARLLILFVSLFVFGNASAQGTPFIDEDYRERDSLKLKLADECRNKFGDPIDDNFCIKDVIEQQDYLSDIPPRGTSDYCDDKYKQMSDEDLKKLHLKLQTQQATARGNDEIPSSSELPGEVTKEHFQTEIACVETYLSQRRDQSNAGALDEIRDGSQ